MASNVGAVFQSSAVVLAIVALSPVPLALPSGIAVAVIGLIGAVSIIQSAPNVVLALAATVAVKTIRDPRRDTAGPVQEVAEDLRPRRVLIPAHPTFVVDVSRPVTPWRWTSVLLAPLELLALAWSVPTVILLLMVPIGLVLAGALWVGRLIVRL